MEGKLAPKHDKILPSPPETVGKEENKNKNEKKLISGVCQMVTRTEAHPKSHDKKKHAIRKGSPHGGGVM